MDESGRKENAGGREVGHCTRREFVGAGGALAGAAALGLGFGLGSAPASALAPPAGAGAEQGGAAPGKDDDLGPLPRRVLGRTGVEVTRLGLGTAVMGEGPEKTDECVAVFSEAIDRGVSYVDTARIYGDAEEALGIVLNSGGRRDKVFLATKVMENERAKAEKSFEESLRLLKVDHVDLLHLHSTGDRDLDQVLAPGGVWDYFLKQKEAGKTRFLGITGHNRPLKFLRMLGTDQVDVMMVAMNFVDRHTYGFEEKVLPEARKRKAGILGMKTFGGILGGFSFNRQMRPAQLNAIYMQNAVRYSLSLEGLAAVVIGVHSAEELRQNILYVKNAAPLSAPERQALEEHGKRLAAEWGPRFGPVVA